MPGARTNRIYWLDLLRVLAAFTVVCLHASAIFVTMYKPNPNLNWWIANLVDSCSRWSVPMFVMISGSLLLSKPIDVSPAPFYRRRLTRVLIPLIVWTLFYLVFEAYRDKTLTLKAALISVYIGTPYYHLWYLYMLLGLYLVAPFINRFVWSSSRNWLKWAIILSTTLMIIYFLPLVSIQPGQTIFLTMFPPYIAYFLLGHYIASAEKSILPAWASLLLAIACGLAIALLTGNLAPSMGSHAWGLIYSYFDPLVGLMSVAVFLFIRNAFANTKSLSSPVPRFVSWVAPLTLGIYVIHPVWLLLLQGLPTALNHISLTGILFTALGAFLISTVFIAVLRRIPLVRMAVI